ncbi:MAG: hypothetical protein EOO87_17790 [Pedobacter sp.]|nr:MAG: hypothetical protein EOO87_17790 [Pedobacter sp.]
MNYVYLLWHTHINETLSGGEDVKLIGIYTSEQSAKLAKLRAEKLNGFKECPEGFEISCNELDKDEWTSGFVTESSSN